MWQALLLGVLIGCAPVLSSAVEPFSGASGVKHHKVSNYRKAVTRYVARRAPAPGVYEHASLSSSDDPTHLDLRSNAVLIYDQSTGEQVYTKNVNAVQPIASITKLMTAMVVLESGQDLTEPMTIDASDIDTLKNTHSRLSVGAVVRRTDLLRLALMASENRAAAALARAYPGGTAAFVAQMNQHAATLGLTQTVFADATGLSSHNVSSPTDLAKMVQAAYQHPLIRQYTTTPGLMLTLPDSGRNLTFNNTNMLVKNAAWHIGLSKTGFINESGQCLVMQASIGTRPFVIVLLDAWGRYSRIADAQRVKKWLEGRFANAAPLATAETIDVVVRE